MMATAMPPKVQPDRRVMLAVELLPELALPPREMPAGVTPPRRPTAPRPAEPAARDEALAPRPAVPAAPAAEDRTASDDSVYLGPPSVLIDPEIPPGLAGLMGGDPCEAKYGPKPKACAGRDLAARTGKMDSVMPRSKEDLKQHFAEYMPTCPYKVGCDGGEWLSSNGTRSVGKPPPGSAGDRGVGTPGAGGAASLGGLHTSVGRLGFNPDHTDPGFGD